VLKLKKKSRRLLYNHLPGAVAAHLPVLTAPPPRFPSVPPALERTFVPVSERIAADAGRRSLSTAAAGTVQAAAPAGLLPILVGRSSSRVRRFLRTNRVLVGLSLSGGEIAD